jgi:hypothetical protein
MWAIVNRSGSIIPATIQGRKSDAIKALIGEGVAPSRPWRWWREQYGLKALRVTVTVSADMMEARK